MPDKIILVDHRKIWFNDFEKEHMLLKSVFNQSEYTKISHIGSTAIPWIKAKPIVDINIGLYEVKNQQEYISRLQEAGYVYATGSKFEKWILFKKIENKKKFHLHLLEASSQRYIEQIQFKEMLMNNKQLAEYYEYIKIRATYDDPVFYYMNKRDFLLRLGLCKQN